MTNTLLASIDAELVLPARLGAKITLYRPTAASELASTSWQPLSEDTTIGLRTDSSTKLRVRVVAQDPLGGFLTDPAWMVTAYSRIKGGSWTKLADRDGTAADFLTDGFVIDQTPRTFRFTVGIPGSGVAATYELVISQSDPSPADDDVDVIYLPDGDLKPRPSPSESPTRPTLRIDDLTL